MASNSSVRKIVLAVVLLVLVAIAVLVGLVAWGGRGFLENPHPLKTEWLTVADGGFEFRGSTYQTKEALAEGLALLQPKPQLVTVRWVAAGASTAPKVPSAEVRQARDALEQAHISTPNAIVGNEVFSGEQSASQANH